MTAEQTVYNALTARGFSLDQAAGIMGNIAHEDSDFSPETHALDTNGFWSYGLVQWNQGSYPNANRFVTGNPQRDLRAQISAIVRAWKSAGITATTPAGIAGEWAANFERCEGCQPGGQQYTERQASAVQIAQAARTGNWPAGAGLTSSTRAGFDWNPLSWPGSIFRSVTGLGGLTTDLEHAAIVVPIVLAAAAVAVVGLVKATGTKEKVEEFRAHEEQRAQEALSVAAVAA